jgi:hypothetical protein
MSQIHKAMVQGLDSQSYFSNSQAKPFQHVKASKLWDSLKSFINILKEYELDQ